MCDFVVGDRVYLNEKDNAFGQKGRLKQLKLAAGPAPCPIIAIATFRGHDYVVRGGIHCLSKIDPVVSRKKMKQSYDGCTNTETPFPRGDHTCEYIATDDTSPPHRFPNKQVHPTVLNEEERERKGRAYMRSQQASGKGRLHRRRRNSNGVVDHKASDSALDCNSIDWRCPELHGILHEVHVNNTDISHSKMHISELPTASARCHAPTCAVRRYKAPTGKHECAWIDTFLDLFVPKLGDCVYGAEFKKPCDKSCRIAPSRRRATQIEWPNTFLSVFCPHIYNHTGGIHFENSFQTPETHAPFPLPREQAAKSNMRQGDVPSCARFQYVPPSPCNHCCLIRCFTSFGIPIPYTRDGPFMVMDYEDTLLTLGYRLQPRSRIAFRQFVNLGGT